HAARAHPDDRPQRAAGARPLAGMGGRARGARADRAPAPHRRAAGHRRRTRRALRAEGARFRAAPLLPDAAGLPRRQGRRRRRATGAAGPCPRRAARPAVPAIRRQARHRDRAAPGGEPGARRLLVTRFGPASGPRPATVGCPVYPSSGGVLRFVVRVLAVALVALGGFALSAPVASAVPGPSIGGVAIDEETSRRVDELLAVRAAAAHLPKGELLEALSRPLRGTPDGADMLIGSATEPERLVIDLRRVDCFTYLDYVAALSRASDRESFARALVETRYAGGQVDFAHRKHFFTDWAHVDRIAAT